MTLQELFAKRSRWIQGAEFQLKNTVLLDKPEEVTDELQCCLAGGVRMCYPELYMKLLEDFRRIYPHMVFISWNDDPARTFEDIQAICPVLDHWAQLHKEKYG